ncbi:42142_t:CDS:2, partial [Gigaspora margarita]
MSSETSTSGRVYNETSTSGHVYNETSTSEHVYNEKYPGYKELHDYLKQHETKSFKTQTLLNPEDFKILEDKVNSDQERYAKNLEDYWDKVISECIIKYDILEYKREKERVILILSEIEEKIKMKENDLIKSSDEWKAFIKNEASV